MAMTGVGIERGIGHNPDLGHLSLDRTAGPANEILFVQRLRSLGIAFCRVRVREQRDHGDAKLGGSLGFSHEQIDGSSLDTRHRIDRLGAIFSVNNEEGVDQIADRYGVLAHQVAGPRRASQSPLATSTDDLVHRSVLHSRFPSLTLAGGRHSRRA